MKKLLMFILVLVGLVSFIQAEDSVYLPSVSGDVTSVLKIQDSFKSPFDTPAWGWNQRSGASNRDSQYIRVKGNFNVSSGIPGATEWFGVLSLAMDANAPDNVDDSNINYEDIKVDLTNAFVMWRPLEISGGRPLGISVGNQTIKATANTAYSHVWGGDLDNDYILHTMSILSNKPMVNVDFHITPNTGIGYAFVKGCSDLIQNSAAFENDYSLTHVAYAEAELAGLQFNAAYQYAMGNRILDDETTTDAGNTYSTADYSYSSNSLNAQLSYDLIISNISFKPYVGYQMLWGDEASLDYIQNYDYDYDTKEANLNILTAGAIISSDIKGKKVTLAGGYNILGTEDFDGLGGYEDGNLDGVIEDLGVGYDAELGYFSGIAGTSSSTYTVAGLDAMYNLEASVELSNRATVSIFLHGQIAKDVSYEVTDEQKTEISTVLQAMGTDSVTADYYADQIADGYDATTYSGTEWTDSMSFGVQVNYKF